MFSALTITSTKQGFAFDAAESAGAYAAVDGIASFAAAVLRAGAEAIRAVRTARQATRSSRLAHP